MLSFIAFCSQTSLKTSLRQLLIHYEFSIASIVANLLLLKHYDALTYAGVKVGFGEADYAKKEETGFLEVFVAKTGSNSGTIVIRITPLTFTQYMEMFTVTPPYINVPEDANYAEGIALHTTY